MKKDLQDVILNKLKGGKNDKSTMYEMQKGD